MANVRAAPPSVKHVLDQIGPLRRGRVVHGDALLVLPEVPPESFDLVVLDWPYATASAVRGKDDGAAGRLYGPVSFFACVCQAVHRVARPGCHVYAFTNGQGKADHAYAMSTGGLYPAVEIAWGSRYVGTGGIWRGAWSPIFFASKGPAEARTEGAHANFIDDVPALRRERAHPYEKPAALWERLFAPSVVEGTRVLDLFAGSASSRAPVEARGGEWYGLDVDPRYAEVEG